MSGTQRLSNYRTTWAEKNDGGTVTYISTEIVRWTRDTITLDSGGWLTVTTKRKMNQASNQFALGFSVAQRRGDWFVRFRDGREVEFRDGMTFAR